jgi:hypothetical protein
MAISDGDYKIVSVNSYMTFTLPLESKSYLDNHFFDVVILHFKLFRLAV